MSKVIKLKRSFTASSVPTTSDLVEGEVAVNTADHNIYVRDDSDNIKKIGGVQTPMNEDLDTNNFKFKNTGSPAQTNGPSYITFDTPFLLPMYTTTERLALTEKDPVNCQVGKEYKIAEVGNTDWIAMGSSGDILNTVFTCTDVAPSGTTGLADLGDEFDGMVLLDTTQNRVMYYNNFTWTNLN